MEAECQQPLLFISIEEAIHFYVAQTSASVARWYPTEPDFENLVKFQSLWCRKISVWNQTIFWWNLVKFQTIWYRENFGLEPDIFLVKSDVISSFLRKNFRLEPYTGVKSHSQVATSNSLAHVTHQPGCRITGAAGSLLDCRRLGLELAAREVAINWPWPSARWWSVSVEVVASSVRNA